MPWIFLILASCCEILWFYCIGYLNQFSFKDLVTFKFITHAESSLVIVALAGYIIFGVLNVVFFSKAIQKIIPSIAFAVWTGLALAGITIADFFIKDVNFNLIQILSILSILAGIIGIKAVNRD